MMHQRQVSGRKYRTTTLGRGLVLAGVLICALLALSACGSRKGLQPAPGMEKAPPVAYGAEKPATPGDMMSSDTGTQQRPNRSAEPLLRSQERPDDPFDLPPH